MFGLAFRWIASNLAGLGAGYFVSDIWNDVKPVSSETDAAMQKPQSSQLTKLIEKVTGWKPYIAAIAGLLVLFFVAKRFGLLGKK